LNTRQTEPTIGQYRPISASLDFYYVRRPHRFLLLIVLGYLVAATLFAVTTPAWQNPDEPAHYNNIAHIATGKGLPVLHPDAYDQEYIGRLLSEGFPPELSIDALRYEAYQPPLYYVTATPFYLLGDGNLLVIRLFNVLLGAFAVLLLYASMGTVFPTKPLLTLGATAFAAFLPMHVAMNASVNNDGLAEVLLLAAMLALLRWMKRRFDAANHGGTLPLALREWRSLIVLGVLLGLGMATKIYAYMALPLAASLVLLTVWLAPAAQLDAASYRPSRRSFAAGVGAAALVVLPALLIVAPLWLRNVAIYGGWDFLGLQMHDRIVVGQPTTAEWIAREGFINYLERAMGFTFRSFWGIFGWMGAFMEPRVYILLLVFSGVLVLGLLWALVRFICGRPEADMDRFQFWVLGFFGVMVLAVLASFIWYNLKFVQHQGRYFFWGLLPISAFAALAWREVMQPLQGKVTGFLTLVLATALVLASLRTDVTDRLTILLIGLLGILLMLQPFLLSGSIDAIIIGAPYRFQRWLGWHRLRPLLGVLRVVAWGAPFLVLFLLDLLIPFRYILPQLAR